MLNAIYLNTGVSLCIKIKYQLIFNVFMARIAGNMAEIVL